MAKALKKVKEQHSYATCDDAKDYYVMLSLDKKSVQFMEKAGYLDHRRRNEASKYMKLLLNVIYILTHVIRLVCGCRDVSENSQDQKTNVSERSDVLDMLQMFAGLEQETHKAHFATFINVIVSQR